MTDVSSTWAAAPPTINGQIVAAEWAGAGHMPIPHGTMLVKNDAQFLYVALDLTGITVANPTDYFWFTVDVDRNAAITANVDVNYAQYPGEPNHLGRQYYLGAGSWTGLLPGPSDSMAYQGFGPTAGSAVNHRTWTMRLALAECGVGAGATPAVPFGIRIGSTSPGASADTPTNFEADFSHLDRVLLSAPVVIPPALAGVVIAGVGLIPATQITVDGYATTDASYYLHVEDAVFAGTLNLIGNRVTLQSLWTGGARRYRVQHQFAVGGFSPLDQTWSNYHWNGATFVLVTFAPDANHTYPMANPADAYSIADLLLQWASATAPAGLHQFRVEFLDAANNPVASPAQTVTLLVDNSLPTVHIDDIRHAGASIPACAIVKMTSPTDGVQCVITAFDAPGHLLSWGVDAEWGDNHSAGIASGTYPAPHPPTHLWTGVSAVTVPSPGVYIPPVTCAYLFRIAASKRATNGYSYIGWVSAFKTVTLMK